MSLGGMGTLKTSQQDQFRCRKISFTGQHLMLMGFSHGMLIRSFQQMESIGSNSGPIFGPSRMTFVPTSATISAGVFVGSTATAKFDLNRRLICHCLLGFSLSDPDDKFSGCKQDYAQTCDPNAPNPKELYEKKTLKFLVWRTSAIYEASSHRTKTIAAMLAFPIAIA